MWATVTATFSEAMDPSSINGSTFELRNAANSLVPATVSYDPATLKAILTPSIPLAASSSYTATVKGGTLDPRAKDVAGNGLSANVVWTFTTAAAPNCPCSGWSSSATPGNPSVADPGAVELGVKFRSDLSGYITGVRFYKGSANTGTHRGNLWTFDGQQLATAIFTSETVDRLATGELRHAGGDHRQHRIRRLLLCAEWQLRRRQLWTSPTPASTTCPCIFCATA